MSEYTEFNYGVAPAIGAGTIAVAAGLAGLLAAGAAAAVTSVADLGRRLEELTARHGDAGLDTHAARLRALDELPLLRAAALAELRGVQAPLTAAGADLRDLPRAELRDGLKRGLARLRKAETGLVRDAVGEALKEMGYRLSAVHRLVPGQTTLRARHANGTAVVVRLDGARARGALDLSGFKPGVCIAARQELQERLLKRGVRLDVAGAVRHDAPQGGCLTAEERARDAEDVTAAGATARPLSLKLR